MEWAQVGRNDVCGENSGAHFILGQKCPWNGHLHTRTLHFGVLEGNKEEATKMTTDKRRYGVIECWRRNAETYHLMIDGELWSEVEWSHDRQAWCVQDAAGHCLTHVEHIVGQDKDPQAAIRLAKRMIVDGSMPTPEQALDALRERMDTEAENIKDEVFNVGEPFVIDPLPEREPSK
jgi:hypothetical protein